MDTLPGEEWKPIEGHDGLYEISNYGRVLSNNFRKKGERVIMNQKEQNRMDGGKGYMQIMLYGWNGLKKYKTHQIHHLVGHHFIPKPDSTERLIIDHLDEDIHNNHIDNLQWVTRSKNTSRKVGRAIKVDYGEYFIVYHSMRSACKDLGTNYSNFQKQLIRNGHFTRKGYVATFSDIPARQIVDDRMSGKKVMKFIHD
ncbi:MAG TPA: NUMOD4 domain-containing protein [Candidatus Paceibacterota bacterium]|nr:NUMOD4 domain-containing protein [Candidatus Paceibacterota bacterium]